MGEVVTVYTGGLFPKAVASLNLTEVAKLATKTEAIEYALGAYDYAPHELRTGRQFNIDGVATVIIKETAKKVTEYDYDGSFTVEAILEVYVLGSTAPVMVRRVMTNDSYGSWKVGRGAEVVIAKTVTETRYEVQK